jgi:hypothetical protein
MKTTRPCLGSIRRALIPAAVATAMTATLVAPQEAHASAYTTVATALGKQLLSTAFEKASPILWAAIFGPSTSSSLSSTDLASIQNIVDQELTSHELSGYISDSDALLLSVKDYYRGTTQSDLAQAYTNAFKIAGDANTLMNHLDDYGLSGSSTYTIVASIRLTFLREIYEIEKGQNALGVTNYSATVLNGALASVAGDASVILSKVEGFETTFEAQFGSISLSLPPENSSSYAYLSSSYCPVSNVYIGPNAYQGQGKWCFSGPAGTTCGASFTAYKCITKNTGWIYDATASTQSKAQANILRVQQLMSYRESQISPQYYEFVHQLQKLVDGDFEYCGNGTCAVGEIDTCSADCTSSKFGVTATPFSRTTSQPMGLIESDQAWLAWQNDGNLVLYGKTSALPSVLWASQTNGNGDMLSYQGDGNLVVYNSGAPTWASGTTGNVVSTRMAVAGSTLYLLNGSGSSVWSSKTDQHIFNEKKDRFCYSTSQAATLLSNDIASVKWESSGRLAIYGIAGDLRWSTGTSGTYLCNQEDGNLVIYDASYSPLWATDTYRSVGGHLQLVGDQLRTTTDSGDVLWASNNCSHWACSYENDVKRTTPSNFCYTTSQPQTLLAGQYASLVWGSDGTLKLKNAAGTTLWTAGMSANAGNQVCWTNGVLGIKRVDDVGVLWMPLHSATGSSLNLAGCNFFVGNNSANRSVFSVNTSCN